MGKVCLRQGCRWPASPVSVAGSNLQLLLGRGRPWESRGLRLPVGLDAEARERSGSESAGTQHREPQVGWPRTARCCPLTWQPGVRPSGPWVLQSRAGQNALW